MPIAPITGKLRKRLWMDLSLALGLGISAGYTYWYGFHLKHGTWQLLHSPYCLFADFQSSVQRQEEFYLQLEKKRQAIQGAE
ncbi:hypothetical protein SCHPADRAFT_904850 [Schizopora paradoxa]|uniref:Cytochrome c oxidase polypeptide VIIA n=1 Tax=Schizopora paradoxa TaxID=27342 RepID=A0A0H2S779_9AGAM|nr:hypothetical protein SCHPADRAFT_904850 [Schizopora paradoxa]